MTVKLSNGATTKLSGSIASDATTLAVEDASAFPALGAGEWFPATIVDSLANMEIIKVTARSGATFTIERAQEGTMAQAFGAGARIDLRLTSAAFTAFITDKIDALKAGAPAAYDTLIEIANKLEEDDGALAALLSSITDETAARIEGEALKLDKSGGTMSNGVVADTNSIRLADSDAPSVAGQVVGKRSTGFIHFFDGTSVKSYAPNNEEFIAEYDLTGLTYVDVPDLGAFKTLIVEGSYRINDNGHVGLIQVSSDNGATIDGSTGNYALMATGRDETGSVVSNFGATPGILLSAVSVRAGYNNDFNFRAQNFNKAFSTFVNGMWSGVDDVNIRWSMAAQSTVYRPQTSLNFIRVATNGTSFVNGYIRIKGIRG